MSAEAPEAAPAAPRTVLVAGAAGGVGTTTLAALLAVTWSQVDGGSPHLVDHSGGSFRSRLPPAWAPSGVPKLTIDDRGARPVSAAAAANAQPEAVLLLVASSTPASLAFLPHLLEELAPAPLHLVLVQVHGGYGPRHGRVLAGHAADLLVPVTTRWQRTVQSTGRRSRDEHGQPRPVSSLPSRPGPERRPRRTKPLQAGGHRFWRT